MLITNCAGLEVFAIVHMGEDLIKVKACVKNTKMPHRTTQKPQAPIFFIPEVSSGSPICNQWSLLHGY